MFYVGAYSVNSQYTWVVSTYLDGGPLFRFLWFGVWVVIDHNKFTILNSVFYSYFKDYASRTYYGVHCLKTQSSMFNSENEIK